MRGLRRTTISGGLRWLRRIASGLAGTTLLVFAGTVFTIERHADLDETRPADAIVVLGAGIEPDGSLTGVERARIAHGVHLYREGYAPIMVLSGGQRVGPPPEADVMAEWALAAGVPQEALVVENQSLNTQQNAHNTASQVQAQGVRTILLITSPFHQWRAERIFEEAGFEVYLSPPPDDPAEALPVKRALFVAREAGVTLVYLLLGV